MIPSKSPYSSGWSSTWTARRLSLGSNDGPLGTAQDRARPPSPGAGRSAGCGRRACGPRRGRPGPPASEPERPSHPVPVYDRVNAWRGKRLARPRASYLRSWNVNLIIRRPMPAHPIGSATISFGLVSVPVKMYSTGEAAATVRSTCCTRRTGRGSSSSMSAPRTARGREGRDGQRLRVLQGSVCHLHARRSSRRSRRKAPIPSISPSSSPRRRSTAIYLEKAYFLGPDKGGERAYRLLARR